MKAVRQFKTLAAMFAMIVMASGAWAQELPQIAVYVTGIEDQNARKAMATKMLGALVNSGKYSALERQNDFMNQAAAETKMQSISAAHYNLIKLTGKRFGVKYVCIADITPAFGSNLISARIVNVDAQGVVAMADTDSPLRNLQDLSDASAKIAAIMFGTATVNQTTPPPAAQAESRVQTYQSHYTVIIDANDGKSIPGTQTVNAGSAIRLPNALAPESYGMSGYTFGGWNANRTGTGANYDAGSVYTPVGNVTLYANWDKVGTYGSGGGRTDYEDFYIVQFHVGAGFGIPPDALTVKAGSAITLPNALAPESHGMSGYTFDGWNTNRHGAGANYDAGSVYTPVGNVTLYANWKKTYTSTSSVSPTRTTYTSDYDYEDFSTAERVGTWFLNHIPIGLGSFAIMQDGAGGVTQLLLMGGGTLFMVVGWEKETETTYWGETITVGSKPTALYWFGLTMAAVGEIHNIVRSVTYKKKVTKNWSYLENSGLNLAVLPDKDGNIKGYALYRMEF